MEQGSEFRQTSGFVTTLSFDTAELGAASPTYPTVTAQGNVVGWENTGFDTGLETRNRNSGNDARLAGIHFNNSNSCDYRFDLPSAGNYLIRAANGDASYARTCRMDLYDTSSSLGTLISGSTGAGNSFLDASNTVRTAAAWPGSNTGVTKTFSTTICRFRFPTPGETWVAYLYVQSVSTDTIWYIALV